MSSPAILALVLGGSAMVTASALPSWRALCRRRGWLDEPGQRKIHSHRTPLAGGGAVLTGIGGGLLIAAGLALTGQMAAQSGRPPLDGVQGGVIAAGALAVFLLGWWDDVTELRPGSKFIGQTLVAGGTVWLAIRLPLYPGWPWLQAVASGVFILAAMNAINFLDNMNGLCAGLACIASVQLAALAWRIQQPALAAAGCAVAGACLGFLPYNYPRASTFLGDSGSHLLGYLLAVLTIAASKAMAHAGRPEAAVATVASVAGLAPLAVWAVPFFDLGQVVLLRIRRGRPVYLGDTNHVSHQLVRRGLNPTTAVVALWLVAGVVGLVMMLVNPNV